MAVLLAIFGALALVGVVLTLKAVFPKRIGDTPYWQECRCNLAGTDLVADDVRRPECVACMTHPNAILRVERHRRWELAATCTLSLTRGAYAWARCGAEALARPRGRNARVSAYRSGGRCGFEQTELAVC
jgi:hypothetical protein